ncbi:MAG: hypothetical protein CMN30_29530 [Sandaracinus sp.]|nr:hypothetical protein [Sandaracinus sp.]|tara:strand:- start:583 stop:1077 length:495 start_codon:yes stop_codon:yes gene_type:complete
MIEIVLGADPETLIRLSPRVTHTRRGDQVCVSAREHPAEIMETPGGIGRFWARGGVVVAESLTVGGVESAWHQVERISGQVEPGFVARAIPWRSTHHSYVQIEWTDGADSYLTGVVFSDSAKAVALTYIANDLAGEYMPTDLGDTDEQCLLRHIEVVLGPDRDR